MFRTSLCSRGHEPEACSRTASQDIFQFVQLFGCNLKSDNLVVQYIKLWHKIWSYNPAIFVLLLQEPCEWSCIHHRCRKLCYELCDREPCNEPCTKLLPCKHPCIGFCGETCPPLCRVCDKDEVTEVFFGTEDEPDARYCTEGWTHISKREDKLLHFVNICSCFFNTSFCPCPCLVKFFRVESLTTHCWNILSVFLLHFSFLSCSWKTADPFLWLISLFLFYF